MGSKSKNLKHLRKNGIRVPLGFTVPSSFFTEAISKCYEQVLENMSDESQVFQAFSKLSLENLSKFLDEQCARFEDHTVFAVRSSGEVYTDGLAIKEDGSDVSLAGQFESYLNVGRNELVDAVLMCWSSLFNQRSQSSFTIDAEYALNSRMDVVIQELIPAKASAVMMTQIPGDNRNQGSFEACWGACGALVSGIVAPDEITFARDGGKIIDRYKGEKEVRIVFSPFKGTSDNEQRVENPQELRDVLCISDEQAQRIISMGCKIEKSFGGVPQDIELVIDDNDEIVVVQSRPITTLSGELKEFSVF